MSRTEELIAEIEKVKAEINNANSLMNTPPTSFGADFTRDIIKKGGDYAGKIAPQLSRTLQKGRPEEIIFFGIVLGAAWAGAYAIDGVSGLISASKARKILLSCYDELAVKQNMLINEQQNLIEKVLNEEQTQGEDLLNARTRLEALETQLERISKILKERSV